MSNVSLVYNRLVERGLAPHQAAALVGRFQQESGAGLNTTAHGDKTIPGGSHGIGQWNRDRLANLKRFGGDRWTDPIVQADFALWEGRPGGPEEKAFNMIRNARNVDEAVVGAMAYERPQGFTWNNPTGGHGYANTVKNAYALTGNKGMSIDSLPAGFTPPYSVAAPPMGPGSGPSMSPTSPVVQDPTDVPPAEQKPGESLITGIEGLLKGAKESRQPMQAAEPIQSVLPSLEASDAARIQAAQAMMSSLLANRRKTRGLSLTGVPDALST